MTFFRGLRNILGAAALAGAVLVTAAPTQANARVFVTVAVAPPVIPVYAQPPLPGYGYVWTPGYWAWDGEGYVWVDGAWVLPPYEGAYWTPGYWGYGPAGYFWNAGYWGPVVGYYGGINYGFGYFGTGFYGGYWSDHRFWYNSCYNRFPYGWKNGYVYNRPFEGHFDGRPGGPAWAAHGTMVNGNRGSYYNQRGNNFAESNRGGFNQGTNRGFEGNNAGNRYDWKRGGSDGNRGGFNQAPNQAPAQTMNNGRQFANNGGGFNQTPAQTVNNGRGFGNGGFGWKNGGNSAGQPGPAHNFVQQAPESRSLAAPSAPSYNRGYSAPSQSFGGNRGYSAPSQSFGGRSSAPSFGGGGGGGFLGGGNFGGGGGGGFHGGGGGGGGFHGGGGHR